MVGRLNENRSRALNEKGGQTPSRDVSSQSPTASAERVRTPIATDGARSRTGLRDRLTDRRTGAAERPAVTTSPAVATQQQAVQAETRRRGLGSHLADYVRQRGPTPSDPATPTGRTGTFHGDYSGRRTSYVHARYYDRPDLIHHDYRYTHTYYDHYNRMHHRVIWPSYYYPVCYSFGHHAYFHDVYPYYHRKYVFISLGGWWPSDYFYMRYYWYGYHPYVWYGYYPIAREVVADNYNYYTYNYYQNDDGGYTSYSSTTPAEGAVQPVDQSTWADVREKLDQQKAEPAPQTVADTRFEEGVKSFEAGDYDAAAGKFEEGMRLAPNDMILPFAYAQALFADGEYTKSAEILRGALSKASPEKEGVFYPRGLYANDDVLFAQIEDLVDKLDRFGYDADMQLLLGYHLLGVGETGYAREPLERAGQDMKNAESAAVLLNLLEKIESEAGTTLKTDDAGEETPSVTAPTDPEAKVEAAPAPGTETTTGGAPSSSAPGTPVEGAAGVKPQDTPNAEEKKDMSSPPQVEPLTEQNAGSAAPIMQRDDANSSGKGPESSDGSSASLAGWSSDAIARVGRYLRVDFAVFAGIVLLGWSGVYAEWRLLGRSRV